jgi:hypothetical protein
MCLFDMSRYTEVIAKSTNLSLLPVICKQPIIRYSSEKLPSETDILKNFEKDSTENSHIWEYPVYILIANVIQYI